MPPDEQKPTEGLAQPAKGLKPEKKERERVKPLTPDQVREALRLANMGVADPRKAEAWRRWLVYSECFEPLIHWKFQRTQRDEATILEACKFVDVSINLAKDLMDQICVVWDKPATRHIGLKPAEDPADADPADPAKLNAPPNPFAKPGEKPGDPKAEKPDDKAPAKPAEAPAKEPAKDAPPFGKPAVGPPGLPGMAPPPKPKKPKPSPQTEALRKLYREHLKVDSWLQELNKLAWWMTEAVVVPQIKKGKMRKRVLLPYFYDPIHDPEDPEGDPIGYVYTLKADPKPGIVETTLAEMKDPTLRMGDVVVLDSESWRIYKHGAGDPEAKHETIKHGLGYVPAARLRFSEAMDGDTLSDYRRHRRVLDSTITCSWIGAKLNYIRLSQDRKLFTLIGDIEQARDDGQTPDPHRGVAFSADSPQQLAVQALDFNTDPANHIKQLTFFYNQAARPYGGTATESMGMAGSVAPAITFSHDAQTEIRVDQIPYARDFERDLAVIVCDMAKQNKAMMEDPELVDALPEADEIREDLSIQFAPLSRKFANFSEEKEFMDNQLAKGLASHYDFARRQDPDLTDEQARDFVLRKLEEAAEVNSIAASRNMPMDGESDMKTLPQVMGKAGPMARDNPSNPSKGPPDGVPKESE